MYLFFDTETNGLPVNPKAPMAMLENWPRIIQFAYSLYDEDRKLLYKYCEMIKPDGWTVPTDKFFIDNGYTTEKCEQEGVPIHEALTGFVTALENCKYIVAHNIMFDYPVVGSEMIRYGYKSKNKPLKICTKEIGTDYCKIPNPNAYWAQRGSPYKWPNLTELHTKLFGDGFDGAHDAMFDVNAMSKCFFEMLDQKIIKLS